MIIHYDDWVNELEQTGKNEILKTLLNNLDKVFGSFIAFGWFDLIIAIFYFVLCLHCLILFFELHTESAFLTSDF